jgi:hypothetical protein
MADHWVALQRASLFFGAMAMILATLSGMLAH